MERHVVVVDLRIDCATGVAVKGMPRGEKFCPPTLGKRLTELSHRNLEVWKSPSKKRIDVRWPLADMGIKRTKFTDNSRAKLCRCGSKSNEPLHCKRAEYTDEGGDECKGAGRNAIHASEEPN